MNTNQDGFREDVDADDIGLSPDDLEAVSGGDITPDSSGSYDAGYALTAVVKQIYDFGAGLWTGIAD